MKNKILFVSNHKGFIKFNAPYMECMRQKGWQVDDVSPGFDEDYTQYVDNHYDVLISRNPFSFRNLKAIKELRKIIANNRYRLIHCHTPMGSVVARVAAIGFKDMIILYTAHGYHFYKGASLINWLLFFPIELLLKSKTDYLVTINNEDFAFAKKWSMAKSGIYKINGVGFNNRFKPVDAEVKKRLRSEMGLDETDFVLLYTAQFITRKNHQFIIQNMPKLLNLIPNLKLILVGNGDLFEDMQKLAAELNVHDSVLFMGGRKDVENFCHIADVYISSSFQEGLCVSNLEAMACGLPLVLSDIRGQNDVCIEGRNGFLFTIGDTEKFITSVMKLSKDEELRCSMRQSNIADVENFSLANSLSAMSDIYDFIISKGR